MLAHLIDTMARTHAVVARPAQGGEWGYIIWKAQA
jgi:hypothetical protein